MSEFYLDNPSNYSTKIYNFVESLFYLPIKREQFVTYQNGETKLENIPRLTWTGLGKRISLTLIKVTILTGLTIGTLGFGIAILLVIKKIALKNIQSQSVSTSSVEKELGKSETPITQDQLDNFREELIQHKNSRGEAQTVRKNFSENISDRIALKQQPYFVEGKQCLIDRELCKRSDEETMLHYCPEDFPEQQPVQNVYSDDIAPLAKLETIDAPITTEYFVSYQDALSMAFEFMSQGLNPVVLNLADAKVPGGGYRSGCGAQEESLSRRSTLYHWSLNKEARRQKWYVKPRGIPKGCVIYTPHVQVFISHEPDYSDEAQNQRNKGLDIPKIETGWKLQEPKTLSIISAAGYDMRSNEKNINIHERTTKMLSTIRAILRSAAHHQHDSIVLGALGAGAFAGYGDAKQENIDWMIDCFKTVLSEEEFLHRFKKIGFAIIFDGNLLEKFRKELTLH